MKCQKCVEGGKTSKVFPMGARKTLLGYKPFYDEHGVYHIHDRNIITSLYRCSNEHMWEVKSKKECPGCGFGMGVISERFIDG